MLAIGSLPVQIDFFMVKGMSRNYTKATEYDGLSSDYTPIVLTISETIIENETVAKLRYNNKRWKIF